MHGIQVSPTNIVKDLGLTIDSFLKFHEHTNLAVSKANRVLELIHKIFQYKEQDMHGNYKLFKSLIRSILEYSNLTLLFHRSAGH